MPSHPHSEASPSSHAQSNSPNQRPTFFELQKKIQPLMLGCRGPPEQHFYCHFPSGSCRRAAARRAAVQPSAATVERIGTCSPVAFNDIKHLARSMPADGLEAQDVVPPRCGCWVARMAIFVAAIGFWGKAHTLARALSRCSACNHLEIAAGDGHSSLSDIG